VFAGITDRTLDARAFLGELGEGRLPAPLNRRLRVVQAEQVHGASIAVVGPQTTIDDPIPGSDALLTREPELVLVVRTADCLPLVLSDPAGGTVGIAHAGWRGLRQQLAVRLIQAASLGCGSRPSDLWVTIGPAVRACCYEVGRDFPADFGPFVRQVNGRLVCDLVACATDQLLRAGVRRTRIRDAAACTACEGGRWYSVRRDGESTGRLLSFVVALR